MTRSRNRAYCTGAMAQMQEPSALGRVVELVRDLRKRCPWDRVQTRETLRPYLVEEVLELDHALLIGSQDQIRSELGDMLLHVAFQIVLGEERGEFGAEDITRVIEEKMWRRHPHLFGKGEKAETWERQKLQEHTGDHRSVIDGLPPTLPAILMAYRIQERVAGVGFDWPDSAGAREKVEEELGELDREVQRENAERIEAEAGDLLFAVVNLVRKLGADPRTALEKANRRFSDRFRRVETMARDRGIEVGRASLEELDALWDVAKKSEKRRAKSEDQKTG